MFDYKETKPNGSKSILFIHGIGASSWMWWQQVSAFPDYQVITVDLPGHGKNASTPWISLADTTDLIAQHVIKNRVVHIVGLSLGGHVALELARCYPEKILSAFISRITVKPMPFQFLLKIQSHLFQKNIQNNRYLDKLAREYYHLSPDKIIDFITNYKMLTRETYETIGKEIMQFRLDESYRDTTTPCLIVAGDQESSRIIESIEIAPKIISTAEGRLIPGAQHAWPVQNPEQFNRTLRDWLVQNDKSIGL